MSSELKALSADVQLERERLRQEEEEMEEKSQRLLLLSSELAEERDTLEGEEREEGG